MESLRSRPPWGDVVMCAYCSFDLENNPGIDGVYGQNGVDLW